MHFIGFFIQSAWSYWTIMIVLTYSNTHFPTLNDKGEAESTREYIMIRGATKGKAINNAVLPTVHAPSVLCAIISLGLYIFYPIIQCGL